MLDRSSNPGEIKQSDVPVPLDFNLGRCALTIKNKCGECVHWKRMAYPAYKKVCVDLGVIEEGKPCDKFAINPERIQFHKNQHAKNMANAIREMSPRELKNMATIINQAERTRKAGFSLGQVVYFQAFGGDYLSNYLKAFVIYADSKHVHVQGTKGCVATLFKTSVLNEKQWTKKQVHLLAENKQRDPNYKKYTRLLTKQEEKIKTIIDKTLVATLAPESKLTSAVTSSFPQKRRNINSLELPELLSISTR